jgi:hypothetical protein
MSAASPSNANAFADVAISAAIFAGLSQTSGFAPFAEIAMGRTDSAH